MNRKKTDLIGVVVTVIILIILVFLSNLKFEKMSYVENAFSKIVMPIQNGFTYVKNKMQGNNQYFADLDKLRNENSK